MNARNVCSMPPCFISAAARWRHAARKGRARGATVHLRPPAAHGRRSRKAASLSQRVSARGSAVCASRCYGSRPPPPRPRACAGVSRERASLLRADRLAGMSRESWVRYGIRRGRVSLTDGRSLLSRTRRRARKRRTVEWRNARGGRRARRSGIVAYRVACPVSSPRSSLVVTRHPSTSRSIRPSVTRSRSLVDTPSAIARDEPTAGTAVVHATCCFLAARSPHRLTRSRAERGRGGRPRDVRRHRTCWRPT